MKFSDIVLKEFETKENISLNEGLFPITPFLAFTSWKNKILKNNKIKFSKFSVKNILKKLKSGMLINKEKTLAKLGKTVGKGEDATVYKLTKQQLNIMAEIYDKYKKTSPELIKKIIKFRENTLSGYQLIKRIIKQNSRIGSKDIFGMTKEQFYSSYNSGLKKIENRGKNYQEKSKEYQTKIREIGKTIKNLESLKSDFKFGKKPNPTILSKVYKKYGVGEEDFGAYTPDELRRIYSSLKKNYKEVISLANKTIGRNFTDDEISKSTELRKYRKDLMSGRGIDLTKKEEFKGKKIGFNAALGKYFLRKEVIKELNPDKTNAFKETYISIIDEMIKKAKEYRYNKVLKLNTLRTSLEFNRLEKKIWEKLPSVKTFSDKKEHYYQKIKEEDFLEKPIYIKRSPELIRVEQNLENEIKRFERELAKIITPSDLIKLKKYRLINNLISVKELKNPEKLFKSTEEIKKEAKRGINNA